MLLLKKAGKTNIDRSQPQNQYSIKYFCLSNIALLHIGYKTDDFKFNEWKKYHCMYKEDFGFETSTPIGTHN